MTLLLQHQETVSDMVDAAISFRRYLSDVIYLSLEKGPEAS